jgi:hypothetical protein
LGGNVARTQALSLVVTLLAGAATAGAGPIGFVGLMVPHAVRRFTGPDWRWVLGYAGPAPPAVDRPGGHHRRRPGIPRPIPSPEGATPGRVSLDQILYCGM